MEQNKPYLRHQRVQSLIEKELSQLILREVEFEAGTLVTISDVVANKKLDYAKIYLSVLPQDNAVAAVDLLKARTPYLASLLIKKLNIRPLPQLQFVLDEGNEHAASIERALLDEKEKNS